eukprot:Gregarina_sp_Poly_1__10847@NODE_83_length_15529_cov_95_045531_g71_i0_p11_GENE_NODE_83_length_15529_cov_95_045531_g71_i0NODE_83_length_15529_cov_95_045531_g71_i0_p11_ORF_typecomplete_len164_score11_24DUF4658/PF15555_6/5_7e03DUF4658/PF15555_6/0_057ArAE_2_N/PF10337_9/0_048TetR/PF13972_6/73TetR/PF13972_6/67TetR/PF13972_6/33_NODE_83_length_15529_cov_95_045531_g71_i01304813539
MSAVVIVRCGECFGCVRLATHQNLRSHVPPSRVSSASWFLITLMVIIFSYWMTHHTLFYEQPVKSILKSSPKLSTRTHQNKQRKRKCVRFDDNVRVTYVESDWCSTDSWITSYQSEEQLTETEEQFIGRYRIHYFPTIAVTEVEPSAAGLCNGTALMVQSVNN